MPQLVEMDRHVSSLFEQMEQEEVGPVVLISTRSRSSPRRPTDCKRPGPRMPPS